MFKLIFFGFVAKKFLTSSEMTYAGVAELVDALDSGSSDHRLWGFKSPLPHSSPCTFRRAKYGDK